MTEWKLNGVDYKVSVSRQWTDGGIISFKVVDWREDQHPRDRRGRFGRKPGGGGDLVQPVNNATRGADLGVPDGRPVLYTEDREAILKMGFDAPGQPDNIRQAVRRLKARQTISAQQARGLAMAVRWHNESADVPEKQQRNNERAANWLSATAAEIESRHEPSMLKYAVEGRTTAKDVEDGRLVALVDAYGTPEVVTVASSKSNTWGITTLRVRFPDGTEADRVLLGKAQVYHVKPNASAHAPSADPKAEDMKQYRTREPLALYDGANTGPGGVASYQGWFDVLQKSGRDSDPIPVKDLTIQGYKVADGLAFRRNGMSYLVERRPGESDADALARAEKGVTGIEEVLSRVPESRRSLQKGLAMLEGRNPKDAHWEKVYKTRGFESAATGGNGSTTMWGGHPPRGSTLMHEFGHNLDHSYPGNLSGGRANVAPGQKVSWDRAGELDREINAFHQLVFTSTTPSGHPITLNEKGVSTYGASAPGEDFAEAFRLWMYDRKYGKLGEVRSREGVYPVRFADLFPERAAILDASVGLKSDVVTPLRQRLRDRAEEQFMQRMRARADHPNWPTVKASDLYGGSGLPRDDVKIAFARARHRFTSGK